MGTIFPLVDDGNFQQILKQNNKVLVVFTSESCGRCIIAKKNLQEVLADLKDLVVFECKVEKAPKVINQYKVSGLPQMKLFVKGEVAYTAFGIRAPQDLYYNLKMF